MPHLSLGTFSRPEHWGLLHPVRFHAGLREPPSPSDLGNQPASVSFRGSIGDWFRALPCLAKADALAQVSDVRLDLSARLDPLLPARPWYEHLIHACTRHTGQGLKELDLVLQHPGYHFNGDEVIVDRWASFLGHSTADGIPDKAPQRLRCCFPDGLGNESVPAQHYHRLVCGLRQICTSCTGLEIHVRHRGLLQSKHLSFSVPVFVHTLVTQQCPAGLFRLCTGAALFCPAQLDDDQNGWHSLLGALGALLRASWRLVVQTESGEFGEPLRQALRSALQSAYPALCSVF